MTISQWPVAAVHRLDLAHPVPALRRDVDDERGVGGLREVGVVLGAGDQDGERRRGGRWR